MRSRLVPVVLSVVLPVVLVLGALGAGWGLTRSPQQRAPLAAALDALPASTGTVDYTRWDSIDGSLDDAALRGVTTRSVLVAVAGEMQQVLGWSATDLAWEAYGRTDGGAVSVLGLGSVSVQRAERSFEAIGSGLGDDDHAWQLDAGTSTSQDFAAAFGWVRVVPDRGLVIGAADQASLDAATAAVDGSAPSLLRERPVADLARRFAGVDSLLLQDRRFLCASSIDGQDGTGDQLSAALDGVGRLADPVWGGRALTDGDPQRIVFAAAFGSDDAARDQAGVRRVLTVGSFVGRSGRVADSLVDPRPSVDGTVVGFDFALTDEGEQFMTDTGPVVFAGCAP